MSDDNPYQTPTSAAAESSTRPVRGTTKIPLVAFVLVTVFVTGMVVVAASLDPGPRGYNIVTGNGLMGMRRPYGFTFENVRDGLTHGMALGLPVGLCAAALAKGILWMRGRLLKRPDRGTFS